MNERTLLQGDINYRHLYQTYDERMERLPAQKKWVREKLGTHLTWDIYVKDHLFNKYPKFLEKLTCLTLWQVHKRKIRNTSFRKILRTY